jgi:glycine betaine/proline transport system substrate-binding protein
MLVSKNRPLKVMAVAAAVAIGASACGGGEIGAQTSENASAAASNAAADCAEINMAVNPWVGYEASAYVVGTVASEKLGCTVNYKDLKEDVSWQGFGTGEVDVVIEDWGHPDLEKKFVKEMGGDGSATDGGPNGNKGIIHWYVPPWLAAEYPDILDYKNLNKYADKFKTSESGDMGQFLGADPSYVQFDEAIVKNLGLDFKVVFSGGEAASITAFQKAEKNKEWLIGYFYEPQWLFAELPLKPVALPPYTEGCQADPAKVACDYPDTILKKFYSTKWAEKADDPGVKLVQAFQWTNEDQNTVAKYISQDKMSKEDAAKKWIADNPDKVDAWLK